MKALGFAAVLWLLCGTFEGAYSSPSSNSDFDDGSSQGWDLANKNADLNSPVTGGNPGGYLQFVDGIVGSPPEYVVAPCGYLGDWSAALLAPENSFISVDALLLDPHVEQGNSDQLILVLSGPGGSASVDLGLPDQVGVWQTFTVLLREADWNVNGTWSQILRNVSSLQIQMDWVNPEEMRTGIDNVILEIAKPIAPSVSWVVSGFDDATLENWARAPDGKLGTISNPGVDGNPGGYMRFVDGHLGDPAENVVAPDAYLGDWSNALQTPEGSHISFDAKLIDPHIEQNCEPPAGFQQQGDCDEILVYLSGPAGRAYADLGLPDQVGVWQSFMVLLRESDWTITCGSWAGLLSQVTQFEIQMDWVNPDPMKTGIDNVRLRVSDPTDVGGREAAGLPVPRLILHPNVPNPFNPSTRLTYSLPVSGRVQLTIHDLRGRRVTTLIDREEKVGEHSVTWQGCDPNGERMPSGVYVVRMVSSGQATMRKVVLAK